MIKIANWNIERVPNQARANRIKNAMSDIDADIWVLTETREIVHISSYSTVVSEVRDGEAGKREYWSAISSRYPIESLNHLVSDKEYCTASKIIHPEYGLIVVYALVLPWAGKNWRGIPSRGGAAFASALASCKADWEQLQKAYPDAVHIVAGDFNQGLIDKHYYGSKKNQEKLELALKESNLLALTSGTNDPIANSTPEHACIDHICISKSARADVISIGRYPFTDRPDKRLSDHFCVFIVIGNS